MMRMASIAIALCFATGALAQNTAPNAVSPEQRKQFRADRIACVEKVKPKELPKGERGKAMRSCMESQNPDNKVVFERANQRREEMKQIRKDCRTGVDAQKLTRDERRTAMQSCIVAKRPELAKPYACAEQARQKGITARTEKRLFMRECRKT